MKSLPPQLAASLQHTAYMVEVAQRMAPKEWRWSARIMIDDTNIALDYSSVRAAINDLPRVAYVYRGARSGSPLRIEVVASITINGID